MSKPATARDPERLFGDSPLPRYAQLSALFRRRIERGIWSPGSQLPTLESLTAEFGVARVTVRQAINLLAQEGLTDLAGLQAWQRPRLPLSGGDLIAMGLEAGPVVAATMQAVERDWVRAGFPPDMAEVRAMARRHVDQVLRSRA